MFECVRTLAANSSNTVEFGRTCSKNLEHGIVSHAYGLQRSQAKLFQAALQRSQIDADVLPEKFLISLSKVFDLAALIQLLQNPDAADHGQAFLNSEPPSFPLIHHRQIGRQFLRKKNSARLPAPKPVLEIARQPFGISDRRHMNPIRLGNRRAPGIPAPAMTTSL